MKKIISAEFVKGILGSNDILKDNIPQVAFIGRSNVGKSTVINSLLDRKSLVKSSATPGKTREINFFLINKKVYFVDLPGYGFAKLSKKQIDKLRKLILWYLSSEEASPKVVVLIIDAKVGLTELDMEMIYLLEEFDHNILIIANKADKLKQGELIKQSDSIENKLGEKVFFYSAKTKKRAGELWDRILAEV